MQFDILVDFFCVCDLCEQNKFVFWYTRRTPGVRNQTSYEDNIKKIVDFSTVRSLCLLLNISSYFHYKCPHFGDCMCS